MQQWKGILVVVAGALILSMSTVANFDWGRTVADFTWGRSVSGFDWGRAMADFTWGRALAGFEWGVVPNSPS